MASITVPCPSCSSAIYLGEERCADCDRGVPPALQSALVRRLEASDAEYRDAAEIARRASIMMALASAFGVLVGGLQVVVALGNPDDGGLIASAALLCATGVMLCAALWSFVLRPLGLAVGFFAWATYLAAKAVVFTGSLLGSFLSARGVGTLFAQLMLAYLLFRGWRSAVLAQKIMDQQKRSTELRKAARDGGTPGDAG